MTTVSNRRNSVTTVATGVALGAGAGIIAAKTLPVKEQIIEQALKPNQTEKACKLIIKANNAVKEYLNKISTDLISYDEEQKSLSNTLFDLETPAEALKEGKLPEKYAAEFKNAEIVDVIKKHLNPAIERIKAKTTNPEKITEKMEDMFYNFNTDLKSNKMEGKDVALEWLLGKNKLNIFDEIQLEHKSLMKKAIKTKSFKHKFGSVKSYRKRMAKNIRDFNTGFNEVVNGAKKVAKTVVTNARLPEYLTIGVLGGGFVAALVALKAKKD